MSAAHLRILRLSGPVIFIKATYRVSDVGQLLILPVHAILHHSLEVRIVLGYLGAVLSPTFLGACTHQVVVKLLRLVGSLHSRSGVALIALHSAERLIDAHSRGFSLVKDVSSYLGALTVTPVRSSVIVYTAHSFHVTST